MTNTTVPASTITVTDSAGSRLNLADVLEKRAPIVGNIEHAEHESRSLDLDTTCIVHTDSDGQEWAVALRQARGDARLGWRGESMPVAGVAFGVHPDDQAFVAD